MRDVVYPDTVYENLDAALTSNYLYTVSQKTSASNALQLMRIDPVSTIQKTGLSANYRLQVDYDAAAFNGIPGSRIDAYHNNAAGVNEDYWFVCASQTYSGGPPAVNVVQLYHFKVVDNSYVESKLHEYNNWAKCAGTHQVSQTAAIFLISETRESGAP